MREIYHQVHLNTSIEAAFDWFVQMEANYRQWHPGAHHSFKWCTDKPVQKGSVFLIEEKVKDCQHKMKLEITTFVPYGQLAFASRQIAFKTKWLPYWLTSVVASVLSIKIKMKRIFKANNKNSTTIILLHQYGSDLPVIGKMVNALIRKKPVSVEEHLQHIMEEDYYMKKHLH